MVIYRTAQQQTNDIFAFAVSLLFMGFLFGLVKSLAAEELETGTASPKLLPHTINGINNKNPGNASDIIISCFTGMRPLRIRANSPAFIKMLPQ